MYYTQVCGFEAFINGKHIVGEVKEKEQAHKEYREAISQGHGTYLMDEETPVCVCVHVYVCACVCVFVCVFVYMCIHVYVCVSIYTYLYACI